MFEACKRGDAETVDSYMKNRCDSVMGRVFKDKWLQVSDHKADYPVHVASTFGHDNVLTVLQRHGYDMNSRNSHTGSTPLHMAAVNGHRRTAAWCLAHGADLNALDYSGRSPLHCAVRAGHYDVVVLLVENGADVNQILGNNNAFELTTNPEIRKYLGQLEHFKHRPYSQTPSDFPSLS